MNNATEDYSWMHRISAHEWLWEGAMDKWREDGYASPLHWCAHDFVSPKMADAMPPWKLAIAERTQESES